jgi:hypothetical protein
MAELDWTTVAKKDSENRAMEELWRQERPASKTQANFFFLSFLFQRVTLTFSLLCSLQQLSHFIISNNSNLVLSPDYDYDYNTK